MNQRTMGAVITVGVVMLIAAFQYGPSDMFDKSGGVGLTAFWLGALTVIIGLILLLIKPAQKFAQGILLGSGILLLIGLSLCSGGFGMFG